MNLKDGGTEVDCPPYRMADLQREHFYTNTTSFFPKESSGDSILGPRDEKTCQRGDREGLIVRQNLRRKCTEGEGLSLAFFVRFSLVNPH